MTGSILQLVAYGIEDIFLTKDPQITYFKIVYRRHTNFSREEIKQNFIQQPDFGKKISCTISKDGDLINNMTLVITLPQIQKFINTTGESSITKVAWVRYIGYSIINNISVEINNRTISKHYGEWMFLYNQMFGNIDASFKKMVGDIDALINFTNGKDEYKLFIPLQFWFCKSSGNSLPLVSLQYSDIKINLELNSLDQCLKVSPTHFISCNTDIVNLIDNEYIEQNVNKELHAGIYNSFDIVNRRLYYYLITDNNFVDIPKTETNTDQYNIVGKTSNFEVEPIVKSSSKPIINPQTYSYKRINVSLGDTYLLVDYYFIDDDERLKFAQSTHDYIIDQLVYTYSNEVIGPTETIKVNIDNPCKSMYWIIQQNYLYNSLDYYNYTDSYIYDISNNTIGNDLIVSETILLNQKERLTYRNSNFFALATQYYNITNPAPTGMNMYFYSVYPEIDQPSGSCNMSKIERIEVKINIKPIISINNQATFRMYSECHNILRISHGLAAVLFER
jgi:hypothetical protein